MKTFFIVGAVLLSLLLLPRLRAAEAEAQFDAKVPYRVKQPLNFPGFTLTYVGHHDVKMPNGLGWKVHDFVVVVQGKEQKIMWSSGTGDIGPTEFSAGGRKYLLELSVSDTLGRLKEGELVVRKAK